MRDSDKKPSQGPAKREEADKATQDNDLTTGHTQPGDGGDDNSKEKT